MNIDDGPLAAKRPNKNDISQLNNDLEVSRHDRAEKSIDVGQPDGQDVENEDNENSLKIVHLKDDCLEKIVQQLNLTDLLNLAQANVYLATIAERIFAQQFQHNQLEIISKGGMTRASQWTLSSNICYTTVSFEKIEKLFEHFGKYLRKIKVFFTPFVSRGNQEYLFFRLVADHCSTSLIEFECRGNTVPSLLRNFQKQFVRLEKLIFSEIFTSNSASIEPLNGLSEVFPNLRSLEFQNVRNVFVHFSVQRIPTLEHFGIYTHPYATFDKKYFPHIHQLAELNPQLSSLGMYDIQESNHDLQLVPMPNIRRLEIGELYLHPSPPFLYENVTHMRITYFGRGSSEWRTLPPRITHLELAGFHISENLAKLPEQCPDLIALTLIAVEPYELNCVRVIAAGLTQIREIEFISYFEEDAKKMLAFSSALIFMENCEHLRKAAATIRVNKNESQFKNNNWIYTKSHALLNVYDGMLKKLLILQWWQWPMKHEVEIIDYIKGWRSEPSFRVSMQRIARNVD